MNAKILIWILTLFCLCFSASAILDGNLSYSYHSFNEGSVNITTLNDTSGNGITLTGTQGILKPGVIGESVYYGGDVNNYSIGKIPGFNKSMDWTLTLWANFNFSSGITNSFYSLYNNSANWLLFFTNNPPEYNLIFACRDTQNKCNGSLTGSWNPSDIDSLNLTNTTWQFITYAYQENTTTLKICLDAVCSETDYSLADAYFTMDNIGLGWGIIGGSFPGNVFIDELGLFNVYLSDAEIAGLYDSGSGCGYPFYPCSCDANWTCSGYGLCNSSDLSPCNSTTDLNSCGQAYTGDYSEFPPQVCDFCTPSWNCSDYFVCNMTDIIQCLNVSDSNMCNEAFTGNLTDYDQSCTFQNLTLSIYSPANNTLSATDLLAYYGINKLANCTIYIDDIPGDSDISVSGNETLSGNLILQGNYKWQISCIDYFQSVLSGKYTFYYSPSSAQEITITPNTELNDYIFYGLIMAFACFVLFLGLRYSAPLLMIFSALMFFVIASVWDIDYKLRMLIGIFGALIAFYAVMTAKEG